MVGFVSEPILEEDLKNQPSKTKTVTDPIDHFLDFESLKEWFEDNPNPDSFSLGDIELEDFEKSIASMGDNEHSDSGGIVSDEPEPFVDDVKGIVSVGDVEHTGGEINVGADVFASTAIVSSCELNVKEEGRELEGVCIEKEMENVTLVSQSASDSTDVEGADVKKEILYDKEESEESESDSDSDSDSESEDSSSASSSDDEKENKGLDKKEMKVEMKKKAEKDGDMEEGEIKSGDDIEQEDVDKMVSWTDDDEDDSEEEDAKKMFGDSDTEFLDLEELDEDGGMVKPIVSKNELQELPPVHQVEVALEPHHQPLPVGAVLSIFGPKVIVEGAEKHDPLSEGSILWITESRSPLGLIDEIFGPVKTPYYVVRYNSEDEVPEGILEGTLVSFVPEFANHVLNDTSLYKKGYDVSGEHEEEVSEEEEFSDDEKEIEYRRMQKMNKRGMNDQKPQNKKKNRNRDNNRTWKSGGESPQLPPDQFPPNQNQSQGPSSTNIPPDFVNRSASASPFPPSAFPPGGMAPPNALWNNAGPFQQPQNAVPFQQPQNVGPFQQPQNVGPFQQPQNAVPFQQQQNAVFPQGLPNNGFPWFSQNPPQLLYQMVMPNFMPFPMQFNPNQQQVPNTFFPGGQPNFFPPPPNAPWRGQGPTDQNMLNQTSSGPNAPWRGQGPTDQNALSQMSSGPNVPWRGQGPTDQNTSNQTSSGPNAPWRGQGPTDQNMLIQMTSGMVLQGQPPANAVQGIQQPAMVPNATTNPSQFNMSSPPSSHGNRPYRGRGGRFPRGRSRGFSRGSG